MTNDSETDDTILQRMREALLRVRQTPARALTPPPVRDEVNVRTAVRTLARSRVSEILRQLRAGQGYSYGQVQEKTGLSQQLLYDVEYKDRRLSLAELRALAECYAVSIDDILGIDLEG